MTTEEPAESKSVQVGAIQDGTPALTAKTVNKAHDRVFTATEFKKWDDVWYLVQTTESGENCATRRLSLELKDDALWASPGLSIKESCVGQNCSRCEFKDSGGCACPEPVAGDGASLCNHTITDDEDDFADWVVASP